MHADATFPEEHAMARGVMRPQLEVWSGDDQEQRCGDAVTVRGRL